MKAGVLTVPCVSVNKPTRAEQPGSVARIDISNAFATGWISVVTQFDIQCGQLLANLVQGSHAEVLAFHEFVAG